MKLSKIVALSLSLSLFSFGCAVGSETHELPTSNPAHELSAPFDPPPSPALIAPEDENNLVLWTVDTAPNEKPVFLQGKPVVNQPIITPH